MFRKKNKKFIRKALLFFIGLFYLNCLHYLKSSVPVAEKEISREFISKKLENKLDYKLTKTAIVFNLVEFENSTYNSKIEVTSKESSNPDIRSMRHCGIGYGDYWDCMLVLPLATIGIGYIFTIPAIIYDFIMYPFSSYADKEKKEIKEKNITEPGKETPFSKAKLRLTNEDTKFDKVYTFKNGKIEVPFSEVNVNYLFNSDDKEVSDRYYYFYSIIDSSGKEIIPTTSFNGSKFKDDQNFIKLANQDFDKGKQQEYKRCSSKFELSVLREGYKYIWDNGGSLSEDELIIQAILYRACHQFKGTDSHRVCLNDFYDCIPTVRYIDNKNVKYNKK
ncbi:hypothetical protein [Leptospira broomii]|nr:hypothetical protein [Leptospira broomii]